ncbi:ABC transporter substrate-binding protein [Chelatococcus reniformis]|uniref:Branched-chain amino acid ABC transporter substrate-binding protein n=1 Tax=Chelatococcus reniformis TaxID=1494448 RepID=A0A916UYF6_9HYPH|nr:ABC transporter substrate-binding protein [Chelatococcus reniformis]GGC93989.1 branched-chain amino acid ABC transporter substrate-binding protein [Chelatococcus reniformis]
MRNIELSRLATFAGCLAFAVSFNGLAHAQKKYDPGANDTEIKIGNICAYSGPASAYATVCRIEAAYFRKINDEGGINGRKINFISYDDAYSPPKAVEQARKLVEGDEVLLIFNPVGTASNAAIQKYMNAKKVPQLFPASGATKWGNPKAYPWTMGWQPTFRNEGIIYAKMILRDQPNAKVGILYQNDDLGKDYLAGVKDGLGDKAKAMIVAEASYELADATIDSPLLRIKAAGADVLLNFTTSKFAVQAIRKVAEMTWKPVHYLASVSQSVGGVMKPAGLESGKGIISSYYLKDPTDPAWNRNDAMIKWSTFLDKYFPEADRSNVLNVYGYAVAQTLVYVLRQSGDDLTRENIMKQAANIKDLRLQTLLPGIIIGTSPTDYYPIKALQPLRFDGEKWVPFGSVLVGATEK